MKLEDLSFTVMFSSFYLDFQNYFFHGTSEAYSYFTNYIKSAQRCQKIKYYNKTALPYNLNTFIFNSFFLNL